HRGRHLDIFNSAALHALRLHGGSVPAESSLARVEADGDTGVPTGRVFNGAELLRGRLPVSTAEELTLDVSAASQRLLSRGVTTVQDATFTNGPEDVALFDHLRSRGALGVRVF